MPPHPASHFDDSRGNVVELTERRTGWAGAPNGRAGRPAGYVARLTATVTGMERAYFRAWQLSDVGVSAHP